MKKRVSIRKGMCMTIQTTYKVVKAKLLDCYHFHGSWFEYDYELELEDENGNVTSGKYSTSDNPDIHNKFVDVNIRIERNDRFVVIR